MHSKQSLAFVVALLAGCGAAGCAPASVERYVIEQRVEPARFAIGERLVEETAVTRKYDLRVVTESGLELELFLEVPREPRGRLPAIFLLAGFETGRDALDLVEERDDVIVMSMNYPFEGERRIEPSTLLRLRRMAFDVLEGGVLAIDYLHARPDVDPERVLLVGVSFGSLFTTPLAAYDERVDGLVLIYGGGDLPLVVSTSAPEPLAWIPDPVLATGTRLFIGDFDPIHHIEAVAPRPLLMANSFQDEAFPVPSAKALYARADPPKKILWYDTGHADLFDKRVVAVITEDMVEELEDIGLLLESRAR